MFIVHQGAFPYWLVLPSDWNYIIVEMADFKVWKCQKRPAYEEYSISLVWQSSQIIKDDICLDTVFLVIYFTTITSIHTNNTPTILVHVTNCRCHVFWISNKKQNISFAYAVSLICCYTLLSFFCTIFFDAKERRHLDKGDFIGNKRAQSLNSERDSLICPEE
jgi:hypothetical protein